MTRAEVTRQLSRMASSRLRRECALWAPEVDLGDGRVDFMGFRPAVGGTLAVDLEMGTVTFVEVKSCMDDFESGHGLNLIGDVNLLVCPRELADELCRTGKLGKVHATYLCPDSSWRRLFVSYDTSLGGDFARRRTITSAEAIWRIVKASYGASFESGVGE